MNEQMACENQQAAIEQALWEVEARVASLEVLSGRLQDRLLLAERKVGSLASPPQRRSVLPAGGAAPSRERAPWCGSLHSRRTMRGCRRRARHAQAGEVRRRGPMNREGRPERQAPCGGGDTDEGIAVYRCCSHDWLSGWSGRGVVQCLGVESG